MTMGTSEAPAVRDRTRRRPLAGDADDGPLVAGLRARDEAAFVTLLRRHQTPMLRIARTYVSSQATAEDVVQDTWLVVLKGVNRFDGRSSLKTWMYRILTNRAKTAGQRERRFATDSESGTSGIKAAEAAVPADRFPPGHAPNWSEEVTLVVRAINRLPPVQRLVITLRDVECWTAAEVCSALSLSETNQRVLLHRARSKVKKGVEIPALPACVDVGPSPVGRPAADLGLERVETPS